jgi:hypothetical protein
MPKLSGEGKNEKTKKPGRAKYQPVSHFAPFQGRHIAIGFERWQLNSSV